MVRVFISEYGSKFWNLDFKYHRANGPAIHYTNNEKSWFWDGLRVSEYEHMMLSGQEITDG